MGRCMYICRIWETVFGMKQVITETDHKKVFITFLNKMEAENGTVVIMADLEEPGSLKNTEIITGTNHRKFYGPTKEIGLIFWNTINTHE